MSNDELLVDIETSPNTCYSWRVGYNINLTPENIIQERRIICISWKWRGDGYVYNLNWDKNQDDKSMLIEFNKVLSEAGVVIGHNIDAFDLKWIKARNIYHELEPLNNIQTIDTLKLARRYFNFNSNKLDYLGQFLGLGEKAETGGYSLWKQVLKGCPKAMKTMLNYCDNDVVLTERVYDRLKAHADRTPVHMGMLKHQDRLACPCCGERNAHKWGTKVLRSGKYQLYFCNDCGHKYRDNKQLKDTEGKTVRG